MKVMKVSPHLQCKINLPAAIRDAEDKSVHSLPPYAEAEIYPIDKYPAAPASWPRGDAKSASYFVGVKEGRGMWLDFNDCRSHTHDVAILLSIQGVNPLTGAPIDGFALEKYITKCPVHKCEFQADRHCQECGFSWPAQNYLASTGTPNGQLWLDGFRAPDGKVRQYVFTAEEARGIAAQIIGDKRSFNIGIAFYLSKEKKKVQETVFGGRDYSSVTAGSMKKKSYGGVCSTGDGIYSSSLMEFPDEMVLKSSASRDLSAKMGPEVRYLVPPKDQMHINSASLAASAPEFVEEAVMEDRMEVAAGAQIRQDVYPDPESLDYWKAEPEGVIYIQYASEADIAKILAGGVRATKEDGFMQALKVGSK